MKPLPVIAIIIVALLVLGGAYYFAAGKRPVSTTGQVNNVATTSTGQIAGGPKSVTTPAGVEFHYYDDAYGLATTQDQLPKSVIPACDEGFAYCLYRVQQTYTDTNLESAGVGIRTRADLTNKDACLSTQPSGFSNLKVTKNEQATYASSAIGPVSDAGAGHVAQGMEYRLWTGNTCTQIDSRIGTTQFANYPAGTKKEFTLADQKDVQGEINSLVGDMSVNGVHILFPGI